MCMQLRLIYTPPVDSVGLWSRIAYSKFYEDSPRAKGMYKPNFADDGKRF